jgi:hypothetical protein
VLWGVASRWGLARLNWILLWNSITDDDYQTVGILDKPYHNVYIVSCGRQSGSIDPPDHRSITMKAVISAVALQAVTDWSKSNVTKEKVDVKLGDILFAEGVTPEMFAAPEKGKEDSPVRAAIKVAIVAGYEKRIQDLLAKDVKTLDQDKKDERRKWQQRMGPDLRDLTNLIKNRIDSAEGETEGKGKGKTSTLESRLVRDLGKYVSQLQAAEGFKGDVAGIVKDLQSAIARVK